MKHKNLTKFCIFLVIILFPLPAFADYGNVDGGGGGLGAGNNNNGWAISSQSGGLIFDAEGLRVYLVNSSTGAPASPSIDITNSNIAINNVYNGQGRTKHEYRFINSNLNMSSAYSYIRVNTSPQLLPRIIPWNEVSNDARIEAVKNWFLNSSYADWVLAHLGTNIDEVRAAGHLLAVEPIAYFRYQGYNYAMTATEAALFNQVSGGGLANMLAPLTHKNLPLSLFLETSEFTGSSFRIDAWTGSRTTNASDGDIINQLGIGYIHYISSGAETDTVGGTSFSYPTDTWVITPFMKLRTKYIPSMTCSNQKRFQKEKRCFGNITGMVN